MLDFVYVAATVGFFALMLAYVRGCAALGTTTEAPVSAENAVAALVALALLAYLTYALLRPERF